MKQLNTLLFAILCLFTGNAIGQQEPAITQFWSTYASINPATTVCFTNMQPMRITAINGMV